MNNSPEWLTIGDLVELGGVPTDRPVYLMLNMLDIHETVNKALDAAFRLPNVQGVTVMVTRGYRLTKRA